MMKSVLISTYWNVKLYIALNKGEITSFNLNLLECKAGMQTSAVQTSEGFNLNLLECKDLCFVQLTILSFVLISTYWNVKANASKLMLELSGFNLNLLECKVLFAKRLSCSAHVLISTYWNVKRQ